MTLTEKILLSHALGWPNQTLQAGDVLTVSVDWTLASELAWNGMYRTYQALGKPALYNKDRFYLALDHTVDRGTLASDPRTQKLVQLSRDFAAEAQLTYFYDANETIMHTEFYRQLVRPGDLVLGADSHTSSHGGLGAVAIGLGGADVVVAMVLGRTWIQVPEAIRVHYAGRLPFGLTGKDVILKTLGELGRNTVAMERTVEYTGDHLEDFSADFRFTIANMTAEFGGLNGIFPADGHVLQAMSRRFREEFCQGGLWLQADPDASYAEDYRISLEGMVPQVAKPFSPDNVFSVDQVVGQRLDGCFIGACTTTEEELILGALILEAGFRLGWTVQKEGKRLMVPGSREVARNLQRAGLLALYEKAGFRVGEPGCSMCLGIASDRAGPGEVWLSSQNRNFPNRMGKGSLAWLASAATVAASAFRMEITDPRPLLAAIDRERWDRLSSSRTLPSVEYQERVAPLQAQPQEGLLQEGFSRGGTPLRGRAQLFGDHVDTDAMIPGEFCHLADLKEIGEKAFYYVRPDFVQRVRKGENIVVAGEGWGCGSSREHAAWALKGAGVRAVVARSFAYIHKRNLVNEAIPFVVLRNEEFYERVRDGLELEVDPYHSRVLLGGKMYQGEPLPPVMKRIMQDGGIIPHVRKRLSSAA